ncbi:MAG: DUF6438 domain-containing protein [Bacteroidia bacterium]
MRNILILSILLCLTNCTQQDNIDIKKVTVAFSGYGCESECPYKVLSVDEQLNVKYYAGMFANEKGYYTGTTTKEKWDSIKVRFDKFRLKGIDTIKWELTDQPDVEFYIQGGVNKNKFKENTGKMSDEDLDILHWFVKSVPISTLIKTDSLTFETSIQYPIPYKYKL